jgi:hypothetical protein
MSLCRGESGDVEFFCCLAWVFVSISGEGRGGKEEEWSWISEL